MSKNNKDSLVLDKGKDHISLGSNKGNSSCWPLEEWLDSLSRLRWPSRGLLRI